MPDELRHIVRSRQHPALVVPCPWCHAVERRACVTPSRRHRPPAPHQQRLAAWVRTVACCPTCQVEPGVPCHLDGYELSGGEVHPARYQEAEVMAA